MLNTKKEFVMVGNLLAIVEISERINVYSGDVDTKVACEFVSRTCDNVGNYSVVLRGQQIKPICRETTGNGAELWKRHGNELLKQFQLID